MALSTTIIQRCMIVVDTYNNTLEKGFTMQQKHEHLKKFPSLKGRLLSNVARVTDLVYYHCAFNYFWKEEKVYDSTYNGINATITITIREHTISIKTGFVRDDVNSYHEQFWVVDGVNCESFQDVQTKLYEWLLTTRA